jgi:hypothetical protein
MSNILNKSNHPVEVKKIQVRMWKLRDEIEDAIARRIEEDGHTDDSPVDIEDIKLYYTKILNPETNESEDGESEEENNDNLDSSGNPMDDDALEMMAALGGGAEPAAESKEDEEKDDTEKDDDKKEDAETEEASEEDDEAAAMAAQMLADQGMGETPAEEEDDEAAKMAAQMLADQGMGEAPAEEEDEAAKMAAQMLADQGMGEAPPEEVKSRGPYTRQSPNKSRIVEGFVLLSDINMSHIIIFSQGTFIHGQNVVIEFVVPKSFTQMVEIVHSVNIARKSKIISVSKTDFRVHSEFLFKFDGERSSLRNFLQSIEPEIPDPPKKLKRPDSDDDDDDFDDLGF